MNTKILITLLSLGVFSLGHHGASQPRNFNPGTDHDLGVISSLDEFYEMLGTNSSSWEDVETFHVSTEEELAEFYRSGQAQSPSHFEPINLDQVDEASLMEFCGEDTSWPRWVCDLIPEQVPWWAVGGATIILFHPARVDAWLDDIARFWINGGFNLAFRIRRLQGQQEEVIPVRSLKTRDGLDITDGLVHFKLEHPSESGLHKRQIDDQGVAVEAHLYTQYSYDVASGEIVYEGDSSTISVDASGVAGAEKVDKRQADHWSAEVTLVRRTTTLPPMELRSCIRDTLKRYFNRSSETNSHSCQPIRYENARAAVGIFINPDQSFSRSRDCC